MTPLAEIPQGCVSKFLTPGWVGLLVPLWFVAQGRFGRLRCTPPIQSGFDCPDKVGNPTGFPGPIVGGVQPALCQNLVENPGSKSGVLPASGEIQANAELNFGREPSDPLERIPPHRGIAV